MSRCGIVILAAGGSSRLGRSKQLLELHGQTLLQRSAHEALATSCRPIWAVLGAGSDEISRRVASIPVEILLNRNWQSGIGTSIRVGVAAAQAARLDAVVLMLCDQPMVTGAAIERLVKARARSGKPIAAAAYGGILGTPAIFAADLFGELLHLADHEGGKAVIARHAVEVEAVDLPEAATDVDTEADFSRLASRTDSIQ
jgi:molybdenum cofactor cytidylyltransferase